MVDTSTCGETVKYLLQRNILVFNGLKSACHPELVEGSTGMMLLVDIQATLRRTQSDISFLTITQKCLSPRVRLRRKGSTGKILSEEH